MLYLTVSLYDLFKFNRNSPAIWILKLKIDIIYRVDFEEGERI